MADDEDLDQGFRIWLAEQRPRNVPQSSQNVLESAERRLVAALKHQEPRPRLIADAERVRRAQLGCIKAQDRAFDIPTDHGDPVLARRRADLAAAKVRWTAATVDEILACYRGDAPDERDEPAAV